MLHGEASLFMNRKGGISMRNNADMSALLPDGTFFPFWEKPCVWTQEIHVNTQDPLASDTAEGTMAHPLKTIQAAADRTRPGTRVLIHAGNYREQVAPPCGGTDPEHMIAYEAYGDGDVIIRASEEVTDFLPSEGWRIENESAKVYVYALEKERFQGYNPFCAVNLLHDRLFIEYDKTDMTPYLNRRGCVFCDGQPLAQVPLYRDMGDRDGTYWVEANGMKVHFRLKGDADPAAHRIEVTVREQCFAPRTPFLNYIKVRGLICEHAAMGAPVPQRGAISAYRGHHWVIENCTVNWANAVAIDVGNECWHHTHRDGEVIGYSVIRGCHIRDAGVCGIAGLFAEGMLIEDNIIEGTGWQKMELSWEAGGIKLHNSVNALIRRNQFLHTIRADHLWLDCGNENNRITGNLFLDGMEQREAIFIECTRDGVNLIDNNIIWNVPGRFDPSRVPVEPGSSGWYKLREDDTVNGYAIYGEGTDRLHISHNLIGQIRHSGYYAKPVSFRMHGSDRGGTSRNACVRNNIFYACREAAIDFPTRDNEADGNLYVREEGGYLRIMYPAPEVCLNLPAWKEFYGLDSHGQSGWFDISLCMEENRVIMGKSQDAPPGIPSQIRRLGHIMDPGMVKSVPADPLVPCDRLGKPWTEGHVLPGPYAEWSESMRLFADKDGAGDDRA